MEDKRKVEDSQTVPSECDSANLPEFPAVGINIYMNETVRGEGVM